MLHSGGLVGDLPFRRAGEDTINTQVWDIAWTKTDLETTIGQAVAMADKLDFVLLKVSNKDVNMVSDVLKIHQYMVMPLYWYKVDQNMMGTHKPVPAVECLVYGYRKDRVEKLFERAPNNPVKRHNMILGGILRSRFKNEKGEDCNPAQSPIYLWYNLLHDLGGGVDVIIDVCSGTGSASVAALELGYNVIAVEKNETQFEVLTHRFDVAQGSARRKRPSGGLEGGSEDAARQGGSRGGELQDLPSGDGDQGDRKGARRAGEDDEEARK
jgi:hypothetical protein